MLFGFGAPFAPNARMKDLFERALFRGVAEYYRAKRGPVQVAGRQKNSGPNSRAISSPQAEKTKSFVGGLVGIEKFRGGQQFAQTMAKTALASGNSARNTNRRHVNEPQGLTSDPAILPTYRP